MDLTVLVPVIVGFLIGLLPGWYSARKALKSAIAAMLVELDFAEHLARTYIDSQIMAPLYRFPVIAFDEGIRMLIGRGCLDSSQARHISVYYHKVREINRGLDNADSRRHDATQLNVEWRRLMAKCRELLESELPLARKTLESARRAKRLD